MPLKDEAWRLSLESYPVVYHMPTRYDDMDANAHLNNVKLSGLLQEARVRLHHDMRARLGEMARPVIMVAHLSIDYLAEGRYPADIDAAIAVTKLGQRSYHLGQALFQDGRAILLAHCVMVESDGEGAAAELTPALRSYLNGIRPEFL